MHFLGHYGIFRLPLLEIKCAGHVSFSLLLSQGKGGTVSHHYSPLRYPGGKGRLANFMKDVYRHNELCDSTYIEPYAGGAAIALTLLMEELAWRVVINDIDPLIYAFWYSVLNETDWLLEKIQNTDVDMKEWYRQREIHLNYKNHSLLEVGFATLFMNRTNRSGIIKAGVIGGKNQEGPFKIDARFNKKEISDRILRISHYKNRITLLNKDAMHVIKDEKIIKNRRCLIYLDPPYFKKGSMLYSNFYTKEDHFEIARIVKAIKMPWILTYDSVPEVHLMYNDREKINFSLIYSANKERQKGSEVMFYNNIRIPVKYKDVNNLHFKKETFW